MTTEVDEYLANPQVPREINYLSVQSPNLLGYYGSNLPKLIAVKTLYDPQNYWQNPLGVPSDVNGQFALPVDLTTDADGDGVVDAGEPERLGPGSVTSDALGSLTGCVVASSWLVVVQILRLW
jgi:hypothetical protein